MNYSFDFKLPGRISETAVFEHSETHISTGRANWESNYTIPVWEETTSPFRGSSLLVPSRTVYIKYLSNDKCSISIS